MIDLKSCCGLWVLASTAFVVGAARPPVEAARPKTPVEAARPVEVGTNSGGPDSPREDGAPAPAAETVKTDGKAGQTPKSRLWPEGRPGTDAPRRLTPDVAGGKSPTPLSPAPVPPTIARPTDPLDLRVDEAIDVTARRVLSVDVHTPWQIGHGMLAFRKDYVLRKGGEKISAYDWVATNPVFTSRIVDERGNVQTKQIPWFYLTKYGARPQKYTGQKYEFEGHPNQFLAFFALARIPLDFEFDIQGRKITFGQMLHNAKMEISDREEVTWDLWAFAYYFDMNERWVNATGEPWSMERLVQTTLKQFSATKSPCGGCHALFALASARNAYLQAGNRLSGVWTQAHMHLEQHIALAKKQQNSDGSFSSKYFIGPQYSDEPSKRISTSGHTLEFLMMSLQQSQLREPWVRNAVAAVSRDLIQYQKDPLEVGGMYHAVHALVLYRERTRPELVAQSREVTPASAQAEPTKTETK
ncbi:MAG: hypothetical protein M3552_08395 [Planctomycetota bacterium]|nr:hypothetical protein [Planctomycetaceae bacterium]MDQ3330659.1 hypothetical protein [Planctomycetota bacterium]